MKCNLNSDKTIKDKSSICNHHLVDAYVYVENSHTRLGLVLNLLNEGYYIDQVDSIEQLILKVDECQMVYVQNGQVYLGCVMMEDSKKYKPHASCAIEHDKWIEKLKERLSKIQSSDDEIRLFLEDRDAFQNHMLVKYKEQYGLEPKEKRFRFHLNINCGTNVNMFMDVLLLRDDDEIFDSDERKKLGIYNVLRLFIHNIHKDKFIQFSNIQNYNPDEAIQRAPKEGFYWRLATLEDILEVYKQGEIDL